MKNIILKILVVMLKILYLPLRILKVKNKITYMSRESNSEPLDFKMIREELEKEYPEYINIVLTKKIEKSIWSKISYCIYIFKQMYHLATSKVIVLDTYCITVSVLPHKKETKIIQIWHALGAIKKFGYQTIGTKNGANEKTAKIMCMHKNYDFVFAPSKETAQIYKNAFNVKDDKIIYIGMPRIDYILSKDEETKKKIYNRYPELKDKINILYVPTFRKKEKVELDELVEKIDTEKYNLIIKLHPLDLKQYKYKERKGVIYDNSNKTYDLFKVADRIITDYSSLSIEASLLDKPIYFYTYDIEKYKNETGLNFDFASEKIGKYNAQNVDKLLSLFEEEYDYNILEEFRNKFVSVNTQEVTKQIVGFIVRLINNEKIKNNNDEYIKEKQNI